MSGKLCTRESATEDRKEVSREGTEVDTYTVQSTEEDLENIVLKSSLSIMFSCVRVVSCVVRVVRS